MACTTEYTYYGEATISKTRSSFKVVLEEHDRTIMVPFDIVKAISSKTTDEEEMIATLIAYIQTIRKEAITDKQRLPKIDEDQLIVNLIKLLETYPIERLIEIFQGLKWHQIMEIFEADDPRQELELYV